MKVAAILIALLLVPALALAADISVTKEMPTGSVEGQTLKVTYLINSDGSGGFDLLELVPRAWAMEWSTEGIDKAGVVYEKRDYEYEGVIYQAHHWSIKRLPAGEAKLTYSLLPDLGRWKFVGIWTYPGGFNKDTRVINVEPPISVAKTLGIALLAIAALVIAWRYRPWRPRMALVEDMRYYEGKKVIAKAFFSYVRRTEDGRYVYWLYDTSGKISAISNELFDEDKLYKVSGTVIREGEMLYFRLESARLA
mgnify:CR=1 FL=1